MGYFSNLAIAYPVCGYDHSFTSPEQQLLWRLDDLRDRLDELKTLGAQDCGSVSYLKDDLRYAPTGYLNRIFDVEAAIKLAVDDLKNKYGIYVAGEGPQEETVMEELAGDQLTLFEIVPFCSLQTVA